MITGFHVYKKIGQNDHDADCRFLCSMMPSGAVGIFDFSSIKSSSSSSSSTSVLSEEEPNFFWLLSSLQHLGSTTSTNQHENNNNDNEKKNVDHDDDGGTMIILEVPLPADRIQWSSQRKCFFFK